jgi:predicted HTH transcriptional regulator
MDTEELEEILEGGTETQTVEFKAACVWDTNIFAKHILALTNVRDGGYIIVGVKEGKVEGIIRQGVTEVQRRSFRFDEMHDQMTQFADPHVNFTLSFPEDIAGTAYVVISVLPFDEVPVICRKDSMKTKQGCIYYRNRDGRVESAPVSNSFDMRDIIMDATVKMMQKMKERGFEVVPGDKQKLDEELNGL